VFQEHQLPSLGKRGRRTNGRFGTAQSEGVKAVQKSTGSKCFVRCRLEQSVLLLPHHQTHVRTPNTVRNGSSCAHRQAAVPLLMTVTCVQRMTGVVTV